jgi:hypothetical protein
MTYQDPSGHVVYGGRPLGPAPQSQSIMGTHLAKKSRRARRGHRSKSRHLRGHAHLRRHAHVRGHAQRRGA